jgi:hypothetical protein
MQSAFISCRETRLPVGYGRWSTVARTTKPPRVVKGVVKGAVEKVNLLLKYSNDALQIIPWDPCG